ncbi:hypothetical protein SD960_21055 [Flavobacterium sp. MMLR14_040]|jgi:hypothetical protein|uniref:Uncharacterized protein n=1 Tax=Flavobacterium pectinovorum TaxID=29533 RepID=A0AB36P522_9FLAO|nr:MULTISPECIES: hypothetical protein [Flavobacterium]KIQ22198.1 hypothetical protein RT99_08355 [Flavobacterium sp. MEB061]MDW8852603.1 hypothetical protein [Flavobacterium sp. MMLR14_040]OXB06747.1 hypothetical protein B0A72_04535 [Flavobacterium pectinovorum]WKL48381.1 hypothetical protein Q1W71_01110 [Flavobacterium pectinovorum]SHL44029.1 hypothetical protein SAMN05444387_0613 [Flavobacterium pectinovorum]
MKKIITLATLFFSVVSFAQIKVLETVPVEKLGKVNNNYIQKIGDEYTVYYTSIQNDDDSSPMRKFSFKNVNNDYNSLYSIIMGGFTASPLYDIKLELPNNYIWLHYTGSVLPEKATVQFMVSSKEATSATSSVSEPFVKDQINKLFQK